MVERYFADPPGPRPGSAWAAGSQGRLQAALAATSRLKPLFGPGQADLAADPGWTRLAELVREQVVAVLAAGAYDFDAVHSEEPAALARVAVAAVDAVLDRSPAGPGVLEPDLRAVVEELVRHRLQVTPADRAGRRLISPSGGFDLIGWAWRIRMAPIGKADDDLLALSDHEIGYFISRRQDAVVVEMTSRSRQRWLLGNFASEQDAARFVVLRIGADQRSALGRRQLAGVEPAPGMVLEDGPTATHLTWTFGWADFPKGLAGRAGALSFSRVVGMPLGQIAALYESPHGQLPT